MAIRPLKLLFDRGNRQNSGKKWGQSSLIFSENARNTPLFELKVSIFMWCPPWKNRKFCQKFFLPKSAKKPFFEVKMGKGRNKFFDHDPPGTPWDPPGTHLGPPTRKNFRKNFPQKSAKNPFFEVKIPTLKFSIIPPSEARRTLANMDLQTVVRDKTLILRPSKYWPYVL